jgi:hypothetical protein
LGGRCRGQADALGGDLDRLADAVLGDGPLAEDSAGLDDQVVQAGAAKLVGLLEAADEGAALDRHAAAHGVHAPVRIGPAWCHIQVHGGVSAIGTVSGFGGGHKGRRHFGTVHVRGSMVQGIGFLSFPRNRRLELASEASTGLARS